MKELTRKFAMMATVALAVPAFAKPMTVVLQLKERVSMEKLAQNVQDPTSDHYQKFYSPSEIRELSAPSEQDYANLMTQLRSEGFTVTNESPTHLWVSVQAEASLFEAVFSTQLQPAGQHLRRQMSPAIVPSHLSLVEKVDGMDNTRQAHPKYIRSQATSLTASGIPQATIKTAYGFDPIYKAGITGQGQHIAIATYDGFHADNVNKFYSLSNLKPGPTVDQVEFNGTPDYDENSAIETELDAEFSGMIATGANVHVFASASNSDAGELAMFTAILDDNRAKVVNYSWGSCETYVSADHAAEMEKVFARAVAQGVNIMVASGDSGSDSCQEGTTVADWPAANDNIVAVGGTTFAQKNGKINESSWNGSGGGISDLWNLPTWQANLGGKFTKRSYPDVAFNADPATGQAIWTEYGGSAGYIVIGGTSMSAPQWSGFMALVGEARQAQSKGPLGYLNPVIYAMNAADQTAQFHDVTAGNNGAYSANAGWDAVTGFGSMQADALLNALTK